MGAYVAPRIRAALGEASARLIRAAQSDPTGDVAAWHHRIREAALGFALAYWAVWEPRAHAVATSGITKLEEAIEAERVKLEQRRWELDAQVKEVERLELEARKRMLALPGPMPSFSDGEIWRPTWLERSERLALLRLLRRVRQLRDGRRPPASPKPPSR